MGEMRMVFGLPRQRGADLEALPCDGLPRAKDSTGTRSSVQGQGGVHRFTDTPRRNGLDLPRMQPGDLLGGHNALPAEHPGGVGI